VIIVQSQSGSSTTLPHIYDGTVQEYAKADSLPPFPVEAVGGLKPSAPAINRTPQLRLLHESRGRISSSANIREVLILIEE
jgi:hypothetical protein